MNTFSIVQHALADTESDPDKAGLDAGDLLAGRVLAAVQVVVDALTPPDGGRYIIGFADIKTAGTSLAERRVTVSSKPLRDHTLNIVEKAVVIATFAAHEIGHTYVTRPRKHLVKEHNAHSGYHAVANLADDIVLEPYMVERNPILKDAFAFTGAWVLRNTSSSLPAEQRLRRDMTTPERFNVILMATRYGDIPEVVWCDDATRSERDWARDWAERLIAAPVLDHATYFALCDEVWVRIRSVADVDDDEMPEEQPPVAPPVQPGEESEDGESDEDEPGEGADDDEQDESGDEPGPDGDESQDETEPGDDVTETTEPGEAPGEQPDEADWDDDDTEESEDESEGTDGEGESDEDIGDQTDAVSDEPDDPEAGDINDDVTPDAEGGGGAPDALRDEDDFNDKEVEKTTHDQAERAPYDPEADRQDEAARRFTSTTVTAFGAHGSMSTQWD